jgi:hypothetical protein
MISNFNLILKQFFIATINLITIVLFKNNIIFPVVIFINYFIAALIFSYNKKELFILLTFSLMLLDYEKYFSFFNFKIWYIFVFAYLPYLYKNYSFNFWNFFLGLLYLLLIALFKGGILDYLKYLIYILIFISINFYFIKNNLSHSNLINIFLTPIYFTFLQYLIYYTFQVNTFLWDLLRPSAFFSESTWFGAYSLFLLFYMFILYKIRKITFNFYFINTILILLLLLLTLSINSYIGLILFILGVIHYQKLKIKIYFFLSLVLLIIFIILPYFLIRFSTDNLDLSVLGRIEGFNFLINDLKYVNLFGGGFKFDYSNDIIFSGAAIGSKAFSLPFQLYNIGGLFVLILFLYLIIDNIVFLLKVKNYIILYLLFSFLILSFFAPLAQGIVGYFFIFLILQFKNDKSLYKIEL